MKIIRSKFKGVYSYYRGGTGLCNISYDEFEKYYNAVEEFGDPNLIISTIPVEGSFTISGFSLHDLDIKRRDLSKFWTIFHNISSPVVEKTPFKVGDIILMKNKSDNVYFEIKVFNIADSGNAVKCKYTWYNLADNYNFIEVVG